MTIAPLPRLVDVTATRATLHRVAETVLAAEQYAANSELALESIAGGFATGWFSTADGERRIRVEGDHLVREGATEEFREPIDGAFDDAAARVLYAWWALGDAVLSTLEPVEGETLSRVVLWPEHFDIAVTLTAPDGRGLNLGFSPGDDFSAEPYVYAGPFDPLEGTFWNAAFGAYRRYSEIDPEAAVASAGAFLADARTHFAERG